MGMYDSFIIDIECPACHRKIKDCAFQTKEGPRMLNVYRLGDVFPIEKKDWNKADWDYIDLLGSCPHCTYTVQQPRFEVVYTWIKAWVKIDLKTMRITEFELYRYIKEIPEKLKQKHCFQRKEE